MAWLCHCLDREAKGNVREIEFFSPNDWQQVEEFGCGPRPLQDADLTIWQLVADRAQRSPKRIALEFYHETGVEMTSYVDMVGRVEDVARSLYAQGVSHGDRVALLLYKSTSMLITILSLLRLGAVCLPSRLKDPDERLKVLLREARPKLVQIYRAATGGESSCRYVAKR